MLLVQTLLQHSTDTGTAQMVSWVPADPKLKRGSVITFKDGAGTWQVVEMYARQESDEIQRGWGLSLPKSVRTER